MTDHDKLREALKTARKWWSGRFCNEMALICDAAESTLPRTKMVEVWRVECAQQSLASKSGWAALTCSYESEAEARGSAAAHGEANNWRCIRITGPHQQEVPA